MAEGLTSKQRLFIEEYLTCWNATEAARRAGYANPNKRGPENVVKSGIREEIRRRLAEKAMPADEVLARLSIQASADVRDLVEFAEHDSEDGKIKAGEMVGLRLTRDAPLHLIKSLTPTRYGLKVELHDQQAALVLLARHHGLLVDRQELSGPNGAPIEIADARSRLLDKLARRAADSEAGGSDRAPGGSG